MIHKKQIRLLIARQDRIGDVVLSTPIAREVKSNKPDSFVAVLVRDETKDIYLNNPFVDKIIILNEEKSFSGFWANVKTLRKIRFTHAFMLLPQERLNWILFFSFITNRIGVGHKLYQFLSFTKYVDRKKYVEEKHEADYCLDMVRKIAITPKSIVPEIYLTKEEIAGIKIFKGGFEAGKIIIGINSTSGSSAPNLPKSAYRRLIDLIISDKKFAVVITDNVVPNELQNIENVLYPTTTTTVRGLINVIASLELLISASTGPMHIAAALKIPTLSFFCPLPACSPKLWGPLGNKSDVVLPEEIYCKTQCPVDPKKCDYSKEGGLDAAEIFERLKLFLNKVN